AGCGGSASAVCLAPAAWAQRRSDVLACAPRGAKQRGGAVRGAGVADRALGDGRDAALHRDGRAAVYRTLPPHRVGRPEGDASSAPSPLRGEARRGCQLRSLPTAWGGQEGIPAPLPPTAWGGQEGM